MKYYIYLLVLIILAISCNNKKNNLNQKEIKKENYILKKESKIEKSVKLRTPNSSNDSDPLSTIRERFSYINSSISNFTKKENKDISIYKDISPNKYSFESESIYQLAIVNMERFYQEDNLKKIIVQFQGRDEDLISEYYFWDSKLIFVFKTKIHYLKSKDSKNFKESDRKKNENRFYFQNDKLIKWIDHKKTKIDLNSTATKKIEKEILDDSQLYKNLK